MSHLHTAETAAGAAAKLSPPVVVSGASLAGVPVPEIVQWLTAIYLVLMIGHKALQIVQELRGRGRRSAE